MMTFEQLAKANAEMIRTDIKGKAYAEVPQRIQAFRKCYPEGTIETEIISLENGVVTMKATVKNIDIVLGTGHAQEKESGSFINKTSFIENCVPLDAQILTPDGWMYYYQLQEGDLVYSLNMETNSIEPCELVRINLYKNAPLVQMATSRFFARCTPEHKWIARTQTQAPQKIATKDLTNSFKIIQAVKQDVTPSDEGRRLGWLMCDCEITHTKSGMPSTAYINQSKYTEKITRLFGEGTETKRYSETWLDNFEWVIPADTVRDILGSFRMKNYKDLPQAMCKAPLPDVAGCLESMLLADGEERGFSSTYIELVEAVQIMCARLGIATTFITSRWLKRSTKPVYTIGIKKTDGAWFSEMEITNVPPRDVWCPTTKNGTWIMRQGGCVTITSNCETSAVGRALGMCGFGSEQSIASAEEVVNAINNQNAAKKAKISKAQLKILRETEIEYGISENYLKECFKCNLEDITEDDYQKIMRNIPLIVEKSEAYEKNKAAKE